MHVQLVLSRPLAHFSVLPPPCPQVHDSVLVERNEVYDHSTDTWSPLPPLPRGPRYAASMVALGTTILLCGGNDGRVALQSCMVRVCVGGCGGGGHRHGNTRHTGMAWHGMGALRPLSSWL